MTKEFLTYEQSQALRNFGFNNLCFGWYQDKRLKVGLSPTNSGDQTYMRPNDCNAPLYQQAFRWFREKHQLDCEINPGSNGYSVFINSNFIYESNKNRIAEFTYEEAQDVCINKLIELVQNKK